MTVNELIVQLEAEVLSLPDGDKNVSGCYCGDLLSWVMGKAQSENVWVTIMSNINVPAVASLADVGCVIIAENSRPDAQVVSVAQEKGVNILMMPNSAYEICLKLGKLL